ncbi:MAG TPA: hypothetical protein VMG10_04055 [Gemmataceae bacterium]|nr:hypothetical protein [Gemmataceae bacterium]
MSFRADSLSTHPPSRALVTGVSLGLLALLSIAPLIGEPSRNALLEPYSSTAATVLAEAVVLLLMGLALAARVRLERASEPRAARNMALFAVLAGTMTLMHWIEVDGQPVLRKWQQKIYLQQFNGDYEVPHNYRPLPQGFACLLERLTHNWDFACISYRWFFTTWFLWASHALARRYLDRSRARLTLGPLVLLYPLSILHYGGQLTDPLNHMLFVLAFLYLLEDRPVALAAALALGIVAKETIVIVGPAYLACYWRRGWRAWWITAALGGVCVVAFVATRLPLGWRPAADRMNNVGLMIGTNLGFGEPIANHILPLWENYLHPLLFVGLFLPAIAWRWRVLDPHLRTLGLLVTTLLLVSNVCYGWLYESRNYIPLVPLLATLAMPPARRDAVQSERKECHRIGA